MFTINLDEKITINSSLHHDKESLNKCSYEDALKRLCKQYKNKSRKVSNRSRYTNSNSSFLGSEYYTQLRQAFTRHNVQRCNPLSGKKLIWTPSKTEDKSKKANESLRTGSKSDKHIQDALKVKHNDWQQSSKLWEMR